MEHLGDNAVELTSLMLALVVALYAIPTLISANGTRPFIVGYLIISVSIVIAAAQTLAGHPPESTASVRRLFIAVVVLGTLVWAAYKGGHAHHGD